MNFGLLVSAAWLLASSEPAGGLLCASAPEASNPLRAAEIIRVLSIWTSQSGVQREASTFSYNV
jgi:hypothetical protein